MKTLYEYLKDTIGWEALLDLSQPVTYERGITYLHTLAAHESTASIPEGTPIDAEESNILFCSYICGRFKRWNVDENEFARQFINVLIRSYGNYKTLIDIYDNERTHLMNGIKVTTDSNFNDTPQDYGTFTDNSHMTNTTHNESISDGTTVMARINEISNNIEDVYQTWADEFIDLFECPQEYKEN